MIMKPKKQHAMHTMLNPGFGRLIQGTKAKSLGHRLRSSMVYKSGFG